MPRLIARNALGFSAWVCLLIAFHTVSCGAGVPGAVFSNVCVEDIKPLPSHSGSKLD